MVQITSVRIYLAGDDSDYHDSGDRPEKIRFAQLLGDEQDMKL